MPSREELLQDIQPGMKLTKAFFMRIYGYEITYPGFAEVALGRLEAIGCGKARGYYQSFTAEYEAGMDAELKEVAVWYRLECEKKWKKEGEEQRKRKDKIMNGLGKMSDGDLLKLWQQRKQQIQGVF